MVHLYLLRHRIVISGHAVHQNVMNEMIRLHGLKAHARGVYLRAAERALQILRAEPER